jgi:hypothetical protein
MAEFGVLAIINDHGVMFQISCDGLDVVVEEEAMLDADFTLVANVIAGDLSSIAGIDESRQ